MAASQQLATGVRDFEVSSFDIEVPVDRMLLSAFIPESLNAEPMDPIVTVYGHPNATETLRARQGYTYGTVEQDGERGWLLALDVLKPAIAVYRLRWKPPLGVGGAGN